MAAGLGEGLTMMGGPPGSGAFSGCNWPAKGLWKSGLAITLGGGATCGSCAPSGSEKPVAAIAARIDFLIGLEPIMTDKTHIRARGKLL